MLGLFNTSSLQGGRAFRFDARDLRCPPPSKTITVPLAATSVALSDVPTLDCAANGMAFAMRMFNDNWDIYADEFLITIGTASDYIYFQKRRSQYQFRWGIVAGGEIQLIDQFGINVLYDGNITMGVSIAADRLNVCVNGCLVSHQTTNIDLPDISDADSVYVGTLYNGSYQVNANIAYDWIKIWDAPLSQTELENATFEAEPLVGATRDENLWMVVKAGQSNSIGDDDCATPAGLSYANTSRIKMLNKDFTLRAYADPYTDTSYGNWMGIFDATGGYSGAGVTLDRLADFYQGKNFAVMPCNRGGTGLIHDGGHGVWDDTSSVVLSTGDAMRISGYAFATYQSMLLASQKTRMLAFEWYQGETDGEDAATVTAAAYRETLEKLFDRWRLVLPPLRIIVGIADAPDTGYANWATIQSAQSAFRYPRTSFVSAAGLARFPLEQVHLTGEGQRDLGHLVADQIIRNNL